mmetsp:Transcript_32574/g.68389  ORF Transcript_32574/g.68389 Transcript_32574/m.68389 type:complete len:265 (+) Transcript_32574:464-1258(+)
MGRIPLWKGDITPSSFNSFGSPSSSPFPKVGSVTKRIRVSSMGQRMILANPPAHTADARNASLLGPPENKERNMGLRDSYTPNFTAPSIPYPITVGPSPVESALGPSSSIIFRAAPGGDKFANAESDCIFVLTTSIGVVTPCDIAALAPPAMKNRGSAALFLSSFGGDTTTILALSGGGEEILSSPSKTDGVVTNVSDDGEELSCSASTTSSGVIVTSGTSNMDATARDLWRKARLSKSEVESFTTIFSWRRVLIIGEAHRLIV